MRLQPRIDLNLSSIPFSVIIRFHRIPALPKSPSCATFPLRTGPQFAAKIDDRFNVCSPHGQVKDRPYENSTCSCSWPSSMKVNPKNKTSSTSYDTDLALTSIRKQTNEKTMLMIVIIKHHIAFARMASRKFKFIHPFTFSILPICLFVYRSPVCLEVDSANQLNWYELRLVRRNLPPKWARNLVKQKCNAL